jgi:hypothetical protein
MRHAVLHCKTCVTSSLDPVHGLQEEVLEVQPRELLWHCLELGVDELEFGAAFQYELTTSLWANAYPIEPLGCGLRSVSLDRDLETFGVQRLDRPLVKLQERLTAGAHDQWLSTAAGGPLSCDGRREVIRRRELADTGAICADEVGVTELADGLGTVFLATGPQVAASKSTKHGRPACLTAFTLQGVEDFFDGVGHRQTGSAGPSCPALTMAPQPRVS